MHIKKIEIRNFRSIKKAIIDLENINIFYGLNDVGKSNVLKALNLFFNGQISHTEQFSFHKDFCNFSSIPNKKAPEIIIKITLSPPLSYQDHRDFTWEKRWRKDGISKDDFHPSPEESIAKKIPAKYTWAKKLKYRYVPAMKDEKYFSDLLEELYRILSESISEHLSLASNNFLSVIRESTREMSKDLSYRLGFESEINFPDDLSSLFSTLIFDTYSSNGKLSLANRGDGIKIRHIPSILQFFHNENNKLNAQGTIRTDTIWGYEEPENNLEGFSTFQKAKQFVDISEEIQVILTTHSPAFYLLKKDSNNCQLLQTVKDGNGETKYNSKDITNGIYNLEEDKEFLTIISPYIDREIKSKNELEELQSRLEQSDLDTKEKNKTILLTEGKTDKVIIEIAWSKLFPERPIPFNIIPSGIDIEESKRNGGADSLKRTLEFLSTIIDKKVIALFDNDRAGVEQIKGLNKSIFEQFNLERNIIRKHQKIPLFALTIPVPESRHLFVTEKDIVQRYFVIEHYFSNEVLEKNKMKGSSILNTEVFNINDSHKNNFANDCKKFDKIEFEKFRVLFDKLLEIEESF